METHLGDLALDAAGARLFESDVQASHGDGADGSCISHGDGAEGGPTDIVERPRATDEELRAIRWKCGLSKASPETILAVTQKLPTWAIEQAMAEHSQKVPSKMPRAPRAVFLLKRDCKATVREQAARHFLRWCGERFGGIGPSQLGAFKAGRMPRGWFAPYVMEHVPLRRLCKSKTSNAMYSMRLRRYVSARQLLLRAQSAVAEV